MRLPLEQQTQFDQLLHCPRNMRSIDPHPLGNTGLRDLLWYLFALGVAVILGKIEHDLVMNGETYTREPPWEKSGIGSGESGVDMRSPLTPKRTIDE